LNSDNQDVLIKTFEDQDKYADAVFSGKYKYLLYGGSINSGKTVIGLTILIALCRVFAGSRWVVTRRDLPTLKRTSIPSFTRIVPSNFLLNPDKPINKLIILHGSLMGQR